MKRIVIFIAVAAAFAGLAPASNAQMAGDMDRNGSLGNYWSGLYADQAMRMDWLGSVRARRTGGNATRKRVTAGPSWKLNPATSSVIRDMVATVPAADRPATRAALVKVMGLYPAIVRAAGQGVGTNLSVTDARDGATIAGVMAYEFLSGTEVTKAQFAAERKATNRAYASDGADRAWRQKGAEMYALASCMMVALKAYSDDPKNPNPELTRQQLRDLAQKTFRTGYGSDDYTKFAPTSKGIVKVN
ncbi:MAG: hypothetical protein H7Y38_00430 [Armatimonadetes bacterium]|nr:hypothetical protein [Armatimonadota bacterium]